MRRKYCCGENRAEYENYYAHQAGTGAPFYQGARGMRGNGLGSVLSSLWRTIGPTVKRVGGQLLRSGAGIAKDMLAGQSFADSARKRASEGISNLLDEPPVSAQAGSGRRRMSKRKRAKKTNAKSRTKRKKSRRDIFN